MKKIVFIISYFVSLSSFGQAPLMEWAHQLGGNQRDEGKGIVTDHLGNVYVAGEFRGTVDFDSGPDVFNLTAEDYIDIFVSKYDMNGQFVWAISINSYIQFGNSLTTDDLGNVYITGSFNNTVDFDPGPDVHQLIGNWDAFILKLDTDGNFVWVKSFGGGKGRGIVVDDGGNVYTTGDFGSTVDFDPGPDVYNLSSNGSDDIFISKLNSNGDFVWAKSIGGGEPEISYSIALDSVNNVYTTGFIESNVVDFDPGPDQFSISIIGNEDLFVSKLDTDGNFIWAKNMGGASNGKIKGYDIVVDQAGSVYTTGSFDGTIDFDPGPDEFNLSNFDFTDIFISKLDNNGDFVWAKDIGGSYEESLNGFGIALDQSGNTYTTGKFEGYVDFNPGPGTHYLNSSYDDEYGDPNADFFVLKLNSDGTFIWAFDFAGDESSIGYSIALDPWDNVYTTGKFYWTIDIDQGCGVNTLIANGQNDAFIHKMNQYPGCIAIPTINSIDTSFTICNGDSIELSAEMPCWVGNISYSWSTGESTGSIVATPDSITTYTLEVSYPVDTAVCISSTSVDVNFYQIIPEIPYNGLDDDCDETTLDDDLDQDGYNLAQDCDDNNPNIPAPPGSSCDDADPDTFNDIILYDGCTCIGNPFIEGPKLEWVHQLGGIEDDDGAEIVTDQWGNVYAAGTFRDTVDFDPGPSENILTADSSAYMVFVSKFAPDGQPIWAVSFGDSSDVSGVTLDSTGNIYLSGNFRGTVDFDPGPNTYSLSTTSYYNSNYILKLNASGAFIWAKKIGDSGVYGGDIAIDESNNIYTTGRFYGTDDFNPGPGVFELTAAGWMTYHYPDAFILKLNNDGNFIWVKQMGGESSERGTAIALDSSNNIYFTYNTLATTFFSYSGMKVNKLNSDGDFLWTKTFNGPARGSDIALDEAGNIYTTGSFEQTVDFDPGPDEFNLTQSPHPSNFDNDDIFISKLSNEGDLMWAKSIGAAENDVANAMALDINGNVYTTGRFHGIVDFDPGTGVYNLSSNIYSDIFVLKLDPAGSFIWAGSFADDNIGFGTGNSIALDLWDNIYTTGFFQETMDFDPDLDVYELTSYGSDDAFIHKMNQQCYAIPTINSPNSSLTICSGDSISLYVEMSPPSIPGIIYSWNSGETLESILVTPDSTSTFSVYVYYPNGADICYSTTSVEVNVIENDTTHLEYTSCDSIDVGSTIFNFLDQYGCDSLVIETTSLLPIPETPIAPDDILIQENEPPFQITVLEVPNATSYAWEVPDGVTILSGAETSSIIIDWNGLETGGTICVTAINDCGSSPSACMEVTVDITDGLNTLERKGYKIFPNPTSGLLQIVFSEPIEGDYELRDLTGKLIFQNSFNKETSIDLQNQAQGVYILLIKTDSGTWIERIVKL